ncbi:hydrogenase maturation protease [Kibdelosporangium philippinense]|uniref:Hydrogenase maturation protease n=1 Tax=Kibdelosporangium philippinense TaxID=211113 RepID=A0ABS8Z9W6_9PSEU|nr:hydrogenase maturation protease [Kibdelosporangium philippinense]MCE7004666.1 hydrogenase maturation protease [Kibdelosporangium philippinense]
MTVVIGIGNPYRCDDGVGPAVADQLRRLSLPDVETVIADGEPVQLLDAWTGAELAIVVDAVLCDPAEPGRIHRTDIEGITSFPGATSSHGLGVPEAVLLGSALDRLPARLVVYAVEAACLDFGTDLSPPVTAAVPDVVAAVLDEIAKEKPCPPDPRSPN